MAASNQPHAAQGLAFRLARIEMGLRQQDLADAAGCARSRVAQLEAAARLPEQWRRRLVLALASISGEAPDAVARRIELLGVRS